MKLGASLVAALVGASSGVRVTSEDSASLRLQDDSAIPQSNTERQVTLPVDNEKLYNAFTRFKERSGDLEYIDADVTYAPRNDGARHCWPVAFGVPHFELCAIAVDSPTSVRYPNGEVISTNKRDVKLYLAPDVMSVTRTSHAKLLELKFSVDSHESLLNDAVGAAVDEQADFGMLRLMDRLLRLEAPGSAHSSTCLTLPGVVKMSEWAEDAMQGSNVALVSKAGWADLKTKLNIDEETAEGRLFAAAGTALCLERVSLYKDEEVALMTLQDRYRAYSENVASAAAGIANEQDALRISQELKEMDLAGLKDRTEAASRKGEKRRAKLLKTKKVTLDPTDDDDEEDEDDEDTLGSSSLSPKNGTKTATKTTTKDSESKSTTKRSSKSSKSSTADAEDDSLSFVEAQPDATVPTTPSRTAPPAGKFVKPVQEVTVEPAQSASAFEAIGKAASSTFDLRPADVVVAEQNAQRGAKASQEDPHGPLAGTRAEAARRCVKLSLFTQDLKQSTYICGARDVSVNTYHEVTRLAKGSGRPTLHGLLADARTHSGSLDAALDAVEVLAGKAGPTYDAYFPGGQGAAAKPSDPPVLSRSAGGVSQGKELFSRWSSEQKFRAAGILAVFAVVGLLVQGFGGMVASVGLGWTLIALASGFKVWTGLIITSLGFFLLLAAVLSDRRKKKRDLMLLQEFEAQDEDEEVDEEEDESEGEGIAVSAHDLDGSQFGSQGVVRRSVAADKSF